MRFKITACLAVLAISLFNATSAMSARVDVEMAGSAAIVKLNAQPAFSLRTSNAGLDPAQRAGIAAKRIADLVDARTPTSKITVKATRKSAVVYWQGKLIVNATKAEAKAQLTTPSKLAQRWALQIKKLIDLPPVRFAQRALTAPLNENRLSAVTGYSRGPFTLSVDPPAVASAQMNASRMVRVTGKQVGNAVVNISTPEGSDRIPLTVAKLAGRLKTTALSAQVTGATVPAEVVSEAAWRAARSACLLEQSAQVSVSLASKPGAMAAGVNTIKIPISIKMDGPGLLPVRLSASVTVERLPPLHEPAQVLFYSNHPEQVLRPQPLYAGELRPDEPARLLYHHQNGTGQPLRVSVVLANTSDDAAKVYLMGALAEPRQDTILVGYRAGAQFLQDLMAGVGYIAEVPANSRIVLWTGVLGRMDTASGIVQMRQIGNAGHLVARVLSEPSSVIRTSQDITPTNEGDNQNLFSVHQYPSPMREHAESYSVGSKWLFIRVGKHAIADAADERVLDGNYGVLYNIDLTLNNPTSGAREVQVMFDATAGIAGIASIINGQFFGKSHVDPPREVPLAKFLLSAGEQRHVKFKTLPLAGSNYPATIVVRS